MRQPDFSQLVAASLDFLAKLRGPLFRIESGSFDVIDDCEAAGHGLPEPPCRSVAPPDVAADDDLCAFRVEVDFVIDAPFAFRALDVAAQNGAKNGGVEVAVRPLRE